MISTEPRYPESKGTESKGILTALSHKLFGNDDAYKSKYKSKFKPDDRVVVLTVKGETITGTVRWVGLIRASRADAKSFNVVGIETVSIV